MILESDATFLAKWGLMDYSLYLVVERRSGTQRNLTRNEFLSVDGTELYHLSVIDYLQDFNKNKQCESWLKSWSKHF